MGSRLAQLGAGAPPRSFWKAKPDAVAKDIHRALAMRDVAAKLASSMAREEPGVDVAADLVIKVPASWHSSFKNSAAHP